MPVGSIGSTTVSTDPRDLNRDGKVSAAELARYAVLHPELDQAKAKDAASPAPANRVDVEGGKGLLDITV